jgi:ParB-like chromosome segregation protein Spo0J
MGAEGKKLKPPFIHEQLMELWPIDRPQYHPENPRQGDVGAICESLDAHGFYGAILVQKSTERIIAGEHRHKSMKAKAATHIPVIVIDVDDDEALDILLNDNATADAADYNRAKLAELLTSIHDRRGNLDGTGHTPERLQELLEDLNGADKTPDAPKEKEAPNLDPGDDRYSEQYGVIVICQSEEEQRATFEMLSEQGLTVKVVCT